MRHERQGLHFAFREPSLHVGAIAVAVFLVEHTRCVMEDIRQGVAVACDSLGCVDPFCERFLSVHGAFKLAFQQRFALCQRIDFLLVVVFAVDDIDRFSRELARERLQHGAVFGLHSAIRLGVGPQETTGEQHRQGYRPNAIALLRRRLGVVAFDGIARLIRYTTTTRRAAFMS